ncbi:MAG: rRNA maturation RNase YbeY [Flavobacterium sp.]|jgi:probable rRNA maturation factor|uniref:rRNA maturation RNase YbeY n=1 Tax=Flavobacterium sp. TaxID=239 RepID=UPI0022C00580|nr:rRNA maturation RNase YbeY [Flavobacterium sp.]MCZ8196562.1 rRNA maturation RNase YbeY [Flavobacterium sp.]
MISFNYETEFQLENETQFSDWISRVILSENKKEGDINYIFCDDEYILEINKQYLDHDYYTDIISFDYSVGNELNGDIFVSIDRVKDNAIDFNATFDDELKRVIIHGILHYCGYKDKSEEDEALMRSKEDEKTKMFHVEH